MQLFVRAATTGQIGALQSLLDLTIAYVRPKKVMGKAAALNPDLQLAVGQGARRNFRNDEYAARDIRTAARLRRPAMSRRPIEERLLFKYHSAEVAHRCVELADALMRVAGGGLVYRKSGMERIYRNMLTGRQHATAQFRALGRTLGAEILGFPENDIFC